MKFLLPKSHPTGQQHIIRIVKIILENIVNFQRYYFEVVDIAGRATDRRSFVDPLPLASRPPLPPRPRDENFDFDGGSLFDTLL